MTELTATRLCVRGCTENGISSNATHGRYCTRCWARLDMPLAQAADIASHLIGNMITGSNSGADRVDSTRDAPVPFNAAAFDDANELYSVLVYWTLAWSEILGQKPSPAIVGAWRSQRGTITGLPAGVTPERAAEATGMHAHWLRSRLDEILATHHEDDIDTLTEQLTDVWRMNARWPRVERPAYSKMPCREEDCGEKIAVYPPAFQGDHRRIVCTAGHWYPEDDYENLVRVFEAEQKERVKAILVAQRLAKKYGIGA
jgi:hypothetical protein